jgi:hypothetical protein
MAVPVVSEPVPAVVGTMKIVSLKTKRANYLKVRITCNERPQRLGYRKSLANRSVYKVHKIRIFVDSEST